MIQSKVQYNYWEHGGGEGKAHVCGKSRRRNEKNLRKKWIDGLSIML